MDVSRGLQFSSRGRFLAVALSNQFVPFPISSTRISPDSTCRCGLLYTCGAISLYYTEFGFKLGKLGYHILYFVWKESGKFKKRQSALHK